MTDAEQDLNEELCTRRTLSMITWQGAIRKLGLLSVYVLQYRTLFSLCTRDDGSSSNGIIGDQAVELEGETRGKDLEEVI